MRFEFMSFFTTSELVYGQLVSFLFFSFFCIMSRSKLHIKVDVLLVCETDSLQWMLR